MPIHGDPPLELLVRPLPARSPAVAASAGRLLLTRRLALSGSDAQAALASLYGLTKAEARIIACPAVGGSLAEARTTTGPTIKTTRNYSKRLFSQPSTNG